MLFCQADYIYYGDSKNNLFYVFYTTDLQKYIEENKEHLEKRKAPDYNRRGVNKKTSLGWLVPIAQFS